MVVAGGGAGGDDRSGGGGAGGFRELKSPSTPYTASPLDGYPSAPNRITVTATGFPITVGAGGAAIPGPAPANSPVGSGTNSVFSTITSGVVVEEVQAQVHILMVKMEDQEVEEMLMVLLEVELVPQVQVILLQLVLHKEIMAV